MKKLIILTVLLITIFSCNSSDEIPSLEEEMEQLELGAITGYVKLSNEYGLHPFDFQEPITVYLTNSNQEVIETMTRSIDDRKFNFDSLDQKKYFIYAESQSYNSCQMIEFEITKENLFIEKELHIKSINFTANLNAVQIDSLVGNKLYHSFDIDKVSYKTLGVRFYLSDEPTVTNQNYKETVMNLAAWASPETSGQYYLFREITPDLYEGDSIYVSVYLINRNADECIGDNGLIYHYPFSEEFITVGFEK